MATDSVPEKSRNLHTLTQLSDREDFIKIAAHLHILQVSLIVTKFALTVLQSILIWLYINYQLDALIIIYS